MTEELKQKKTYFFAITYVANFNYLACLGLISMLFVFDKDPYLSLLICGIPVFFTIIISHYICGKEMFDKLTKEKLLIRLGIAHTLSILGLVAAIYYLFVY